MERQIIIESIYLFVYYSYLKLIITVIKKICFEYVIKFFSPDVLDFAGLIIKTCFSITFFGNQKHKYNKSNIYLIKYLYALKMRTINILV